MKNIPRISETEWAVMQVLWAEAPLPAHAIIARLAERDHWHPRTAKTLLNRLVKKQALGFRKEGRAYLYRPLVTEAECVEVVSESFLDRVFGGSLTPMLAHFVEQKKLSAAELRALRRILDGKE